VAHALDGAHLKRRRANEHLDTLNERISRFFGDHAYAIGCEFNPEASEFRLYATGYDDVPLREWGVHIGDCLHNLRSALDHLTWQLALLHLKRAPTETEAPSIQFPIESDSGRFERAKVRQFVSGPHFEMLAGLQPYPRGDRAPYNVLAMLQRLSNVDKHRVINAAAVVPEGHEFAVTDTRDVESYGEVEFFYGEPMEKDAPIGRLGDVVPSGENPYVQMEGPFTFGIIFRDPEFPALDNEPIGEILGQIGIGVELILRAFTREFAVNS
jgi:hypothetical protein